MEEPVGRLKQIPEMPEIALKTGGPSPEINCLKRELRCGFDTHQVWL